MNKKLLGISLAISAVLASVNITSASEKWVNNDTIENWSGHTYENIDNTSYMDGKGNLGGGIYNGGTISKLSDNTYTGNKAGYGGGLFNNGIIESIEKEVYSNNTATSDGGAIINQDSGTIKNISATFKGNSALGDGGAIYNFGDYEQGENKEDIPINAVIEAINGTFEKNTASNGGAIANDGKIGSINGIFTENSASTEYGGAIYNDTEKAPTIQSTSELDLGKISSIGGTFTKNTAKLGGGAIYNRGTIGEIKDAEFVQNTTEGSGGAIYNDDTISSIKNSTFRENSAKAGGGAIMNSSELNISDCTFEANTAELGGAIFNNKNGNIKTLNSNFNANKATSAGGAVFNSGNINAIGGSFANNSTTDEKGIGGAIANKGTIDNINAKFDGNSANYGGAIVNVGAINTIGGTFTNNKATTIGGAIFTSDMTTESENSIANLKEIKNATFKNNSTTAEESSGGAIANAQKTNPLKVSSSTFAENNSVLGGAIASIADMSVENSTFSKNTAKSVGGAIHNQGAKLTVNSSNFNSNSATTAGGAIYNDVITENDETNNTVIVKENATATINNSTFTDNSSSTGGAIYSNDGDLNVNSSTFNNNYTTGTKVTIKADDNTTPIIASQNGGAIVSNGNLNIKSSSFNNNTANIILNDKEKKSDDESSTEDVAALLSPLFGGGAIATSGSTTIDDTSFVGNSTNYNGGAILVLNSEKGTTIKNSAFANNSAGMNGGAISSGDNIDGTGIFSPDNITITDTDFVGNTAGNYGGAIFYSNGNTDKTVNQKLTINAKNRNVVFSNNKAEKGGNDIYLNKSTMDLNTENGKTISFNSGIAGNGTINSNGDVILNSAITPDNGNLAVNINNGTIKLAVDNYLDGTDVTIAKGGTLDLINGQIGMANINNLVSNNGNVKIDMDLSDSERFTDFANVKNASGTLNISEINIIADIENPNEPIITGEPIKIDNLAIKLPDNGLKVATNDYLYTVTINDKSEMEVTPITKDGVATKIDGFTLAVNKDGEINGTNVSLANERSFSATKDIEITETGLGENAWNGNLGGTKLTVNGNGHTLNGAEKNGINIGDGQTLDLKDISINGFKTSDSSKGALNVKNNGTLNISAINKDINISGVNAGTSATEGLNLDNSIYLDGDSAKVNLTTGNSRRITINNALRSANVANEVLMKGEGTIVFNGEVDPVTLTNENARTIHNNQLTDVKYNLNSGMVGFTKDSYLAGGTNSLVFNGGMLNIANGAVNNIDLKDLTLSANSNIAVDADLAAGKMDTLSIANTPTIVNNANLNVSSINLLSDATKDSTVINFVSDDTLKSHITTTVSNVAYSPIYKYGVGYDATEGSFEFTRGSASDYNNVNPAVMVAPVAAQLGGYFNQLNAYDQAFSNMDMTMLMTKEQRQALKLHNKYAYDGDGFGSVSQYSGAIPEERAGFWARPYTSYEKVNLKNGPKVSNVMYGTFFGGDTAMKEFRNGFDGVFSTYIGYNGSHQVFNGNSLWQNGGTLGVTGTLYKGDWFGGWTIATGLSGVDANTMYGSENFGMWSIGTALKTGYNWELLNNKFIIQPHFIASYSLVDTFNYTNAAGLKIHSDPLSAVQLAPGLKFIGNLKDGWQPYLGVDFMWNIMDKTKFTAMDTSLPQLSVKPYIQYGIGVQKRWGERSTGYAQAMFRNIGRNGVIFSLGYRAAFGRGK